MSRRSARLACLIAVPLVGWLSGAAGVFTDVSEKACRTLIEVEQERVGLGGVSVQECPAPPGVRLFVVDSGSRTWPVLGWQHRTWSLEPVIARYSPGENAMIGAPPSDQGPRADKVEWLLDAGGLPTALTFRIAGRSVDGRWTSRLLTVRLDASGVCLAGVFDEPDANQKARQAIDFGLACLAGAPALVVRDLHDGR